MSPIGRHRLNNFDWYDAFGCYFDKDGGIEGFWDFAELKEPFSHDYADENGKDYDLTVVYFQDKQMDITGTMTAKTQADLIAKRNALKAILFSLGEKTWWVKDLNRNFQFFYRKMTFKPLTRVDDSVGKIGFTFQLTIQLLSVNDDNVPTYPNDFMLTKTVATYAAMTALGTPAIATRYKIAIDETKDNSTNTLYEWWPDGTIKFIPSSAGAYFLQYHVASHAAMMAKASGQMDKLFFVAADEVNRDDYGVLGQPAVYMYTNGLLNKLSVRKDV